MNFQINFPSVTSKKIFFFTTAPMTLYTEKHGRDVARIERTVILISVVTKYLTSKFYKNIPCEPISRSPTASEEVHAGESPVGLIGRWRSNFIIFSMDSQLSQHIFLGSTFFFSDLLCLLLYIEFPYSGGPTFICAHCTRFWFPLMVRSFLKLPVLLVTSFTLYEPSNMEK